MASSLDSHSSSHSCSLSPVLPTTSSSDGEDSTVGSHGSVEVDYTSLFELPRTKLTSLAQCWTMTNSKNWSLLNDVFGYDLIVIHDIHDNTWIIKIKYMVLRNAKYKYIHGDLIIHTSTYTVWILKIQVHTSTCKTEYTCNVYWQCK